jgi:ribosomal protein L7Ae-like RNA K-turn-binding protein
MQKHCKVLRLMGLARRAGQLACGLEAVKETAGRAKLVLLASDAGNSVRREAERAKTRIIYLPYTKDEIGKVAGRKSCAIAAVTDAAFYKGIAEALQMEGLE